MNYSINAHLDASIWLLLEANTPSFQGMYLYPLPMLGEDADLEVAASLRILCVPDAQGKFFAVVNMTRYSKAVAFALLRHASKDSKIMLTACNQNQIDSWQQLGAPHVIEARVINGSETISQLFDGKGFDPLAIAKCATFVALPDAFQKDF